MMKSWHSLIQKIEEWRQKYQHHGVLLWQKGWSYKNSVKSSKNRSFSQLRRQRHQAKLRDFLVMLVLSIIALTSVVGYRFYNQPQLTVGKIAPITIKAPYSTQFEDAKTTSEKRKEVQTGIVPIFKARSRSDSGNKK